MLHVLRHQQLLHRGDHDIAECKLLPIEDNTAERQCYCIVFQRVLSFFTAMFVLSFPKRDDVNYKFHHSHIWYILFSRKENTICAQLSFVDGTDSFHIGENITTYSISIIVMRSVTLITPNRFVVFFGQLFFIMT